jgi:ribose transport system ATP-binding protein
MRLEVRGVEKAFGATKALREVSFDVEPGSILAVLGENGAGKSTLMKILAGAEQPDRGTLKLDGVPYAPADPRAARRDGVAIVYQELSVCPDLTVAENVLLGMESQRFGFVSRRASEARVARAFEPLARTGAMPKPRDLVRSLSTADRQLVEIGRALAQDGTRLLILDEPTSSLTSDDVERLFQALQRLRAQGLSILYISHFLDEVRRLADAFTVLRDGATVRSGRMTEASNAELIEAMAGRGVTSAERAPRTRGERLLEVTELAGRPLPERASFELFRGEVLGIAGLVGSGRTELLRALFGLDPVRRGNVKVGVLSGPVTPRKRLAQGVGLLSEDRKGEGLFLALSLAENVTLSRLGPLRRRGLLQRRAQQLAARAWLDRLGVRYRDVEQPVVELSGGNQQKIALARLLYHDVDVLLLDEPTRGIDVLSRNDVHALIDELARQGKAVLLVSSQLEELLAVADRIAVMRRGVLGEARPRAELSEHALLSEATLS